METYTRKRIEIFMETAFRRRLVSRFDELGITGYTLVPVMGGRGEGGEWSREGQVSTAGDMMAVICITDAEKAETVVEAVFELISPSAGVLNISDVEVVRGEKF